MLTTELKVLDQRILNLISYGSSLAAGLDLRACYVKRIETGEVTELSTFVSYTLYPNETVLVGSGLAIYLDSTLYDGSPINWTEEGLNPTQSLAAMLLPRSGLGTKLDIRLANTVGLVDADYQGEVLMALKNGGDSPFTIKALDRLAQMVIVPVLRPTFTIVEEFTKPTERGAGGFGSTGTN